MKAVFSGFSLDPNIMAELDGEWKKRIKENTLDLEDSHYFY